MSTHRTYSSPSQHSLDSSGSQEQPSSTSRPTHLQTTPPDHLQGQGSQHSLGQASSSRSSSSLPRARHSPGSGSLHRAHNSSGSLHNTSMEEARQKSMSLGHRGTPQGGVSLVGPLSPQDFSTRGGARVLHQFQEALLEDEGHAMPQQGRGHAHTRSHDPYHQRSHVDHRLQQQQQQQSFDQWQQSHDQQQGSHDFHQRSYSDHYQRSRDHKLRDYRQLRSHDHQGEHQQRGGYGTQTSREEQQRSHDRSHDQRWQQQQQQQRSRDQAPEHFKYPHPLAPVSQQYQQQQQQRQVESPDYPLPDSPAPPPYKSPSPDSEQAQVLEQLGRGSRRQMKKQKFAYHAGALGMGPEPTFTDLSQVDDVDNSRMAARERVMRGKRSPPSQKAKKPEVTVVESDDLSRVRTVETQRQTNVAGAAQMGSGSRGMAPVGGVGVAKQEEAEPDFVRELEELMGGMEAIVSEAAALEEENRGDNEGEEPRRGDGGVAVSKGPTASHQRSLTADGASDSKEPTPTDTKMHITTSGPASDPLGGRGSDPGGVITLEAAERPLVGSDTRPQTMGGNQRSSTEEDNLAGVSVPLLTIMLHWSSSCQCSLIL